MAKKNIKTRPGQVRFNFWLSADLLRDYQQVLARRAATTSGDLRLYIQRTVAEAAQRPSP